MGILADQALTPLATTTTTPAPPSARLRLRAGLWFDPDGCALISGSQCIPLTAQETDVLILLAQKPRYPQSAARLAELLDPLANPPIEPHCIEETIRTLRRKLGEDGKHQDLIRTKRRRGYALFPQLAPTS
jgi:DNA-binding response OmpR family regulator